MVSTIAIAAVVAVSLSGMVPVMVLALFGTMLVMLPVTCTMRFRYKKKAVRDFCKRLDKKLMAHGEGLGKVHSEALELGRSEVWNVPFIGHRTGLSEVVVFFV